MFKSDFARTVTVALLTVMTSTTLLLGALGPAEAGAGHRVAAAVGTLA